MRLSHCSLSVIPLLLSCGLCFASSSIEKTVLDNGLTVLVQPMPSSEVISIYACVKTGSAVEGEFSGAGISHFVEHMLFKGTARRPVGAIAKEVKALGGRINASTGLDYTLYTLDIPAGTFRQGLDIMSDMLMNSVFDSQQVEKEREVVHGEMRLYHDQPGRRLSEDVFRNAYIRHPYRHPIIGYMSLFDGISRDELYGYYRNRYIPNNIVLSVAGAVDAKEVLPLIEQAFKGFKRAPYPERGIAPEPAQVSSRYFEEHYATPLFRFSLAYQGIEVTNPDLYALDVLSMALGQGESSRLYAEVYKKKDLVRQISSTNFTPGDKGVFEIQGMMVKDNLPQVRQEVERIIADIKRRGLSAEELAKTKRQVLSEFVFGNQTSSSLAYRAAVDEALTGDTQFSKHYVEAVKQVTNEDIERVAQRYLNDRALSVTVLKPLDAKTGDEGKQGAQARTPIQKTVLDNGLTILLKEDHSVGVVAIDAVVNAGIRQETRELNGISRLLSQAWIKGTKSRTDVQIAMEMERRGGSLEAFSGRNSVGIQIQVLAEDLPFSLDLLADLIVNPSFTARAIKEEKDQMLAAIDARDDNIDQLTTKRLMETLYLQHPYRLDPLGSKETVNKISRKDILGHYSRLVRPGNMVISVFGDFDSRQALVRIREKFAGFKKGEAGLGQFLEPPPRQTRVARMTVDKEQAMAMFGFQGPAIKDNDRWPVEVLDSVLGAGLSGRLFTKVRDELGRAYTVGSYYALGPDNGTIVLFVLTTADKVDSVKEIVQRELLDIRNNLVPEEELENARAYSKGMFKMELATPAALGAASAIDELFGLGHDFYKSFDAHVDAVTAQDLRRVANQYLDINKAAIVITTGEKTGR